MRTIIPLLIVIGLWRGIPVKAADIDGTPGYIVSRLISAGRLGHTSEMYRCFSISTDMPFGESGDQRQAIVDTFVSPSFIATPIRTFSISNCAIVVLSAKDGQSGHSPMITGLSLVRRRDNWRILPDSAADSIRNPLNGLSESEAITFTRLNEMARVLESLPPENHDDLIAVQASKSKLIGMWSNGKDEYSTISLGLRHDGTGLFAAGMSGGWIKWTNSSEQVVLLGSAPMNTNIVFQYDAANDVLEFTTLEGNREMLVRININEPPSMDSLRQMEELEE